METGLDKARIEALVKVWHGWTSDVASFRLLVCLVLVLAGGGALLRPQALALAKARKANSKAETRARKADELVFYTKQIEAYSDRLFLPSDVIAWQQYVLEKLALSGARLRTLEPKKPEPKGVFKVVELELNCTGPYRQLVDFIDRLERGPRIVRVTRLRIERRQRDINLELVVRGLIRGGATGEAEAAPDPAAQQALEQTIAAVAGPDGLDEPQTEDAASGDATAASTGADGSPAEAAVAAEDDA